MVGPEGFQQEEAPPESIPSAGKGPCYPCFASANESSLWLASQPFISPLGSVLQTKVRGWGGGGRWRVVAVPVTASEKVTVFLPFQRRQDRGKRAPPPRQAGLPQVPSVQESKSSPGDTNTSLTPQPGPETHNLTCP